MNKIILGILLAFLGLTSFAQGTIRIKNYNSSPSMDESTDGIWTNWVREIENAEGKDSIQKGFPDSLYLLVPGIPNYGDVYAPDFELKMKPLWHHDTVFFLFQRIDNNYVTGYTNEGNPDLTVSAGLDNRDATKIYFYLSTDSSRLSTATPYSYSDSIAWLQFGWKSDDVQASLPGGQIVETPEAFHSQIVQWCEGIYCYTKISIALGKIAPYLSSDIKEGIDASGFSAIGFMLEATENDKEIGTAPYSLQTRVYWGVNLDSTALDDVSKWGWLVFLQDTNNTYSSFIEPIYSDFASVYPNPVRDHIVISSPESFGQTSYQFYDIMGRLVLSGNIYTYPERIYLQQIKAGTYILRLQNATGQFMNKKIVVLP